MIEIVSLLGEGLLQSFEPLNLFMIFAGCLAGLFILGVRAWFGRVELCLSSTGDRALGPTASSAPRRIIGWLRPELAALCVNRT